MFKNLINLLSPISERNIDKNINWYKKELIYLSDDINLLEKQILITNDLKQKCVLKIKLFKKLKQAYKDMEYQNLEDSIDKSW